VSRDGIKVAISSSAQAGKSHLLMELSVTNAEHRLLTGQL